MSEATATGSDGGDPATGGNLAIPGETGEAGLANRGSIIEQGLRGIVSDCRLLLAGLFVLFAAITSLFLAWNTPPFLGPDELSHALRANMTVQGRLVGERLPTPGGLRAGGPVEEALLVVHQPFNRLAFHPERKVSLADFEAAARARWSQETVTVAFADAAGNAPILYLPQSAAFALAEAARLSPVQGVYLARLSNALACIAIGFVALLFAGRARYLVFALLLLPMATALYGSMTVDGMIITLSALTAAILGRAMSDNRPVAPWELAVVTGCLLLLGTAKWPYALLSLPLAFAPSGRARWRYLSIAVVVFGSLAWAAYSAAVVQTPVGRTGPVVDAGLKLALLLDNPLAIWSIAWSTLSENGAFYYRSFIGILGVLDAPLFSIYYWAALPMLLGAAAFTMSIGSRTWDIFRILTVPAALVSAAAFFGIMYIFWTPIGAGVVEGVQGRYFLPIAIFMTLAFEGERRLISARWSRTPHTLVIGGVLLFPLITHLVVERSIILRYYLG
jgi:uncharacterized membrane protein